MKAKASGWDVFTPLILFDNLSTIEKVRKVTQGRLIEIERKVNISNVDVICIHSQVG